MPFDFHFTSDRLPAPPPGPAAPRPEPRGRRERMGAKYDAAQTTDENRKHWAAADALSANAGNHAGVRFVLRNRARYETHNNCYAKAGVRTLADDLIGTGPRLQLTLPADADPDGAKAKAIEQRWAAWAKETHFPIKLRVAEKSRNRDGECFGIFATNERLACPVKLFVRWVEAEQCATPFPVVGDPYATDGVRFDRFGMPLEYDFLKFHPGDFAQVGLASVQSLKYDTVPAHLVLHWFTPDRFGQLRGIPEITPALPLFAQLRRFTLATLTAAEIAAMLAGVMKTNLPPGEGETPTVDRFELIELVRGALLTLPGGYDATQFRPEHPQTTYPQFKGEILGEAGRATGQPLNIATGNSSGYNFSSGRLDHLPYNRGTRILRNDLQLVVLDPTFAAWATEAVLVPDYLPAGLPPVADWAAAWAFDGFDSIDPVKDATADDIRLANGTANLAGVLGEIGEDWRDFIDQLAREIEYCRSKGVTHPLQAAIDANKKAQPPEKAAVRPTPPAEEGDGSDPPQNGHRAAAPWYPGGRR